MALRRKFNLEYDRFRNREKSKYSSELMGERRAEDAEDFSLIRTPTWIVGGVCIFFITVSLIAERAIHFLGKWLLKTRRKPLFDALEKMKEEAMLLGFISLLLTVTQRPISSVCMPKSWAREMTPCTSRRIATPASMDAPPPASTFLHDTGLLLPGQNHKSRRLLARESLPDCPPGKIVMISLEGLHQVHIFIFVMGVVHIFYSCMTLLLGLIRVRSWKKWEQTNRDKIFSFMDGPSKTHPKFERQSTFIVSRTSSPWCRTTTRRYLFSFLRQFGQSVTESDYLTLRAGFIKMHNAARTFDFHRYLLRTLEDDFKTVVGISSFLWCFVVIFMVLNVHGRQAHLTTTGTSQYCTGCLRTGMSSMLVRVLLDVLRTPCGHGQSAQINVIIGTKLQHIITQLAVELADADLFIGLPGPIKPRDTLFWFDKPQLLLHLTHFVFFLNAFELAFFIWLVGTYGFHSCLQDKHGLIYVRVVVGVLAQFLCSYSTFPSYAIVTQMGSHYKKAIFEEYVKNAIMCWQRNAKTAVKKRRKSGEISNEFRGRL